MFVRKMLLKLFELRLYKVVSTAKYEMSNAAVRTLMRQQMMPLKVEAMLKSSTAMAGVQLHSSSVMKPSELSLLKSVKSFSTSAIQLQEEKPHDHARLWVIEKGTAAFLVVLIPLGLLIPNRIFDSVLAILITAHTYWGMEAIMVEYVRVILFGNMIPKIAMGFVYVMTVLMLGGLFYLIFNDIGMCRAFWRIWRNMRKPNDAPQSPVPTPGAGKC